MNKPKLKKLLTLLVCLMLIASMVVLAACNKEETPVVEETPTTAEPSFTNGNFTSFSTSDVYPKTPSSWTAMSTIGDGLPAITANTVAGIISLDGTIYDNYKSKWDNLDAFAKYTEGLSEDYTVDDDVLMIYNKEPSYFTYSSASFTASANTYYKLSVDIRTAALDGGASKGATLTLTDGNGYAVSEFKAIDTDAVWTRYTFYVKGKLSGTNTLKLQLTLGAATVDTESAYLTSGYAFFDNVQFDSVTADEENDKTAAEVFADYVKDVTTEGTKQYIDLSVPNPDFDFVQTATNAASYPSGYTRRNSSDSNALYGRVSLAGDFAASMTSIFGSEVVAADAQTPGFAGSNATRYSNAYALYAKAETVVGFSTTTSLYFKRGNAYAITIWVNAEGVTSGKVHIALAAASDEITAEDTLVYDIDAGTVGWKPYTFVFVADQNTSTSMYFHMWLGNDTQKATGYALFDNFSIANPDISDYSDIGEIITEYQAKQSATIVYQDKTILESDSKLVNGYFSAGNSDGWVTMNDEGKTNMLNGVDNSNVETSVITVNDDNNDVYQSAYYQVSRNILKIDATNSNPTVYGLAYNTYRSSTGGLKENLKPYTAYRFSVWVKTVDVQSTAGVILTMYDGVDKANRTAVATYAFVNTKDISEADGMNGYRELSCYFYTGATEEEISFELTFGTGSQWTATTLFDGVAYVSNASLTEVEYSDFNSASSSGTYQKKYNYNTYTSPEFTNGQFDTYKMPSSSTSTNVTKGFTGDANDGKVDGEFQNTSFGIPEGWTLSADSSITSEMNRFAGIVDLNRPFLLTNLKQAAGTANFGGVKLSDYDFDTLFFNYGGTDLNLYSYVGGKNALMLAAADDLTLTGANFASLNATSSSVSLNANTYYEISVLVKTLGNTRASVYLTSDDSYEVNASTLFKNVSTITETATNGWQKYTFRVKVGLSSVTAQLKVCLGQSDTVTDALATGAGIGGIAFFDYVTLTTITEEVFNADVTPDDDVVKVALDTDSFGDINASADTKTYCAPSSTTWTGTADVTAGDNNKFGIVKKDSFDFEANGNGLESVLVGYNGSNSCLVINNAEAGAYHYTNKTGVTFTSGKYYKVSVYVKTYNLSEDGKAYVKLGVTGYDKADDGENVVYVNSDGYQLVEFFVKAPEKNTLTTSVFLTLGLGEEDALVSGIAVFDNVKYEQITVTEAEGDKENTNFKALAVGDYATAVVYNDIDDTTVDPETNTEERGEEQTNNYRWVIFTSVAFGAVIVLTVIIYFVKKYLPKKKEKTDFSKKPKKADKLDNKDDYKDLQD